LTSTASSRGYSLELAKINPYPDPGLKNAKAEQNRQSRLGEGF